MYEGLVFVRRQFKGRLGVLLVNMETREDSITNFDRSFDAKPPNIWRKK